MSFISYVIILTILAFMLPGIVTVVGTTGMLWGEGFAHVAKWSLYSMEVAAALIVITALHLYLAKFSLRQLVQPALVLIMGVFIIPLNTAFLNYPNGLTDAEQAAGPLATMSQLLSGIVEMLVRHGTGALGVVAAMYAIFVISKNKPKRGFMRNLFKN